MLRKLGSISLSLMAAIILLNYAQAQTAEEGHLYENDAVLLREQMDQLEEYDGPITELDFHYLLEIERYRVEDELRMRYGLEPRSVHLAPSAPIDPPREIEIPDGSGWVLGEPLYWRIGSTDHSIHLPQGFFHDKASIPQALQWLLKQTGKYSRAAAIHDFLYWRQDCSRRQADNLMMIAMKESGVLPAVRQMIYRGVRLGGRQAWRANSNARKDGVRRIYTGPVTASTTSESIQEYARAESKEAANADLDSLYMTPVSPETCALGDSTDVPMGDSEPEE